MSSLFLSSLATVALGAEADRPLVTFDGAAGTTFKWEAENDPVMGGQSVGRFTQHDGVGEWVGEVKIVPFLHAAGFCTCRTDGAVLPDLSAYHSGGLVFEAKVNSAATNLTNYQMQFDSSVAAGPKKGRFTCNFQFTPASDEVYVPFSSCVESWRGEPEGGPPSAAQLAKLVQIGVGTDGVKGDFSVAIKSIAVRGGGPAPSPAAGTVLVDFAKGSKTRFEWTDLNDPVMGGRSTSTFTETDGLGIFNGTVRIVPQLKAPGFCNAEARPNRLKGEKVPDVSAALGGGLVYRAKSTGKLSAFKAAFGTFVEYNFGSYKADFVVPADGAVHDVFIPFGDFSNKWSSATGEPTTKCSDDKSVCPTAKSLAVIGSVGVWAEGAEGDFHLELVSVSAVAQKPTL